LDDAKTPPIKHLQPLHNHGDHTTPDRPTDLWQAYLRPSPGRPLTAPVKLTDLPAQQLSAIKSQLTDDLNALSTSFSQLRAAQARFRACVRTLASPLSAPPASPSKKEDERRVLVPLTASLYVPGTLLGFPLDDGESDSASDSDDKDKEKAARGGDGVLVDVGTGFFVRKSRVEAGKFYEARVAELDGSLRDLEGVLGSKSESLRVVEEGMFC
jgi:prefoldin alpha subunit